MLASGQMFTQVYPANEFSPMSASVQWNGDTMIMAGWMGLIMRSVDAGQTWEDLRPSRRDWNFHNAVTATQGVYLLAEPTVWNTVALPPGHRSALLLYEPRTNSLKQIAIPALAASDSSTLTIVEQYEIAAAGDVVFLFQGGNRIGRSLHRSINGGLDWSAIGFPDSLNPLSYTVPYLACQDSLHVALRLDSRIDGSSRRRLYVTTNAGREWNVGMDFSVAVGTPGNTRNKFERATFDWLSPEEMIAFTADGETVGTSDAGFHWNHIGFPPFLRIVKVEAFASGRGYVLADGHLYRTNDGFKSFQDIIPDQRLNYFMVAGEDTIIASYDNDNIFITYDGGVSWDIIRMNQTDIEDIRMGSDENGIALIHDLYDDSRKYYKTRNGWRSMDFLMDETTYSAIPCRIFPKTATTWYRIEERPAISEPVIRRTTDEGETWSVVLAAGEYPILTSGKLVQNAAINDTNYIGITIDKTLIFSSDRGANWNSVELPLFTTDYSTQLFTNGPSWILLHPTNAGFRIDSVLYSDGDWTTWTTVLTEPDTGNGVADHKFHSINADAAGNCLVYLDTRTFQPGIGWGTEYYMYSSNDQGRKWTTYSRANGADFAVFLPDGSSISNRVNPTDWGALTGGGHIIRSADNWRTSKIEDTRYGNFEVLLAGGEHSLYLNGSRYILKNSTGGINGIHDPEINPTVIQVDTPYPHPVRNNETVQIPVNFSTLATRQLTITLMDVLGRQVRSIVSRTVDNSSITIPWQVTGLAPGLYVLRVQAGDEMNVRPIVVR